MVAEILYHGGPLTDAGDDALRIHSYRAYNRWLADFCAASPSRLIGAAALPVDSVELAIQEFEAALEMGFGRCTSPCSHYRFVRRGRVGPPVRVCSGIRDPDRHAHSRPSVRGTALRPRRDLHDAKMMARLLMAESLSELIQSGVLARHPDLRIVSVEAEIGWLPWVLDRMDHNWHRHRFWAKSELPRSRATTSDSRSSLHSPRISSVCGSSHRSASTT